MAITYKNTIQRLECFPKVGDETDVVCRVDWYVEGTDDKYSASYYGSFETVFKEGDPFKPYEDLTFDDVWTWVTEVVDMEMVKQTIKEQIETQANPKVITLPLPWVKPITE